MARAVLFPKSLFRKQFPEKASSTHPEIYWHQLGYLLSVSDITG